MALTETSDQKRNEVTCPCAKKLIKLEAFCQEEEQDEDDGSCRGRQIAV